MDWITSGDLPQKDDIFYERIDEDLDLAFALSLQEEFNDDDATQEVLTKEALARAGSSVKPSISANPIGIVDAQWELIDPHPDIHALFIEFNAQFFYGKLHGVEVKWSPRMTLCAGVCSYEGRGGLCSVRLSQPLLKLRPRRDLVETLLHEMIHAYLFVTANNKDHDAHGPEFLSHMYRINKETGTKISVYHSFHDEVDYFRKHWWKCNGPCAKRSPFYGVVKRAMNRAPGPKDRWWKQHQETCGGVFQKTKEPQDYKQKSTKRKHPEESSAVQTAGGIKSFFPSVPSTSKVQDSSNTQKKKKGEANIQTIKSIFEKENNLVNVNSPNSTLTSVPVNSSLNKQETFSGKGFTLGSSSSSQPTSFLSKIRKEIGYPNSKSVKPHASAKNSMGVSANASVRSSQNTKPNISVQGSRNTKPNMSVPSSRNTKPNMSVPSSRTTIPNVSIRSSQTTTIPNMSVQSSRYTKPNVSVQSSQITKPNMAVRSSQVVVPNNKKLQSTSDSSSKKGAASFVMDSETSVSNVSKRKLLQSSIDSFVTSPVRTSHKGLIQANNTTKREEIEISNPVICPVCFIDVPSEIINRHLDCCLNKCS